MDALRLKDIDLATLVGKQALINCAVKAVEQKTAKSGSAFLKVSLMDGDTVISATAFSLKATDLVVGNVYKMIIDISLYNDAPSCIIQNAVIDKSIDLSEFIPWVPNYAKFTTVFNNLSSSIKDQDLNKVLNYAMSKYKERLMIVPAGRSQHHTQFGGCVMHTTCIAVMAEHVVQVYNSIYGKDFINRDLLITAALLHDIAKCEEYDFDEKVGSCEFSDESALSSHITNGVFLVQEAAMNLGIKQSRIIELLIHCIYAHHGKLDYGSPVTPAIPEATILSCLDGLDAEMWKYDHNYNSMDNGEGKTVFSMGEMKRYFKP